MYEKLKTYLIAFGALVISVLGVALGIIEGRNRKTSGSGQTDLDKNNSDIRQQLDSDRNRTEESGRIMAESEGVAQRMGDAIESGSESTDRTGTIIEDTRDAVSRIIEGSE